MTPREKEEQLALAFHSRGNKKSSLVSATTFTTSDSDVTTETSSLLFSSAVKNSQRRETENIFGLLSTRNKNSTATSWLLSYWKFSLAKLTRRDFVLIRSPKKSLQVFLLLASISRCLRRKVYEKYFLFLIWWGKKKLENSWKICSHSQYFSFDCGINSKIGFSVKFSRRKENFRLHRAASQNNFTR